jgi:hypothetical protein
MELLHSRTPPKLLLIILIAQYAILKKYSLNCTLLQNARIHNMEIALIVAPFTIRVLIHKE